MICGIHIGKDDNIEKSNCYRAIWNRYPPSLVTGRSISGAQIFTLVTGRKFQRFCKICKGGGLYKKRFRIVTGPNSGDEIFRIVTGSKLVAKQTLNGGVSNPKASVHTISTKSTLASQPPVPNWVSVLGRPLVAAQPAAADALIHQVEYGLRPFATT